MALLLPLDAPDFAPAAEAVRAGCQAALKFAEGKPELRILRTDAQPGGILAQYQAAVQQGAGVIVGPMTRNGIAALAASNQVVVTTLALNTLDGDAPASPRLYTLGLSIEAEARMAARYAHAEELRDAIVVHAATPLAKRAGRAFAEEWSVLGGKISDVREFGPQTDLPRLRERLSRLESGMIFLAADAAQARRVRPYLNNQIPVFATSQIHDGRSDPLANGDLNGIRFVDMPWLVQPDHTAVMVYPRPEGLSADLQRFYALGIDACRIAGELLRGIGRIQLDGVTGRISSRSGNALEREPVRAVFRNGAGIATEDQR